MIAATSTAAIAWRVALNGQAFVTSPVVAWIDNPDGTIEAVILDGDRAERAGGGWALLLERGQSPARDDHERLVEHLRDRLRSLAERDELASTVAGRLRRGDALALADVVGLDDVGSELEARCMLVEGSSGEDLRALGLALSVDEQGNLSGVELPWHVEPRACVRARLWLREQS